MKVKIIYDEYISELEKRINDFIIDKDVLDIKYRDVSTYYGVIIMYDDRDEWK